jgi:hypothetical protein
MQCKSIQANMGHSKGNPMGWCGQHNRDEDERVRLRALPLSRRYAWGRIGLMALAVAMGLAGYAPGLLPLAAAYAPA